MADDPFTMYYVVRKDVPRTLGGSMALAGAAAVRCVTELGGDPGHAAAFERWSERPRKVALRASADELDELHAALGGSYLEPGLACLPPMRKSDRPPLLAALRPFTDPPRPREAPAEPPLESSLAYVIRDGVLRTAGKAMAQAGHAAVMASADLELAAWRSAGMPGVVRRAAGGDWERLAARDDAVVVRDAGLTQVEAGTETVIALAPGSPAVEGLEPVP
jgi:peptidyl-tRNA hydrolase